MCLPESLSVILAMLYFGDLLPRLRLLFGCPTSRRRVATLTEDIRISYYSPRCLALMLGGHWDLHLTIHLDLSGEADAEIFSTILPIVNAWLDELRASRKILFWVRHNGYGSHMLTGNAARRMFQQLYRRIDAALGFKANNHHDVPKGTFYCAVWYRVPLAMLF